MNNRIFGATVSLLMAWVMWMSIADVTLAQDPFIEDNIMIHQSFAGENIGDGFGWVGANIGDINRDGFNDMIITAPFYGADGSSAGKAYVYSACSGRLLNEVEGDPGELLGFSAATVGDLNQDGVSDYILGALGGSRATVYSGRDHSVLLTLTGNEGDGFGASVAGAGDVNGDSVPDLFIGATRESSVMTNTGRVYLFSGADGAILWQHDGPAENSFLGGGVGKVGDINQDNIPDQVAAAHGASEAYVFSGVDGTILLTLEPTAPSGTPPTFGRFFARGAGGDVDGDGIPDIFLGDYNAQRGEANGTGRAYIYSGADGSAIQVFEAETDGDGLGPGRGIPDIDGDGLFDVIAAAWTSSAGTSGGGRVYLYSGVDQRVLGTITGNVEADALGVDALSLDDISGDGVPDYLVTAVGNDFNGNDVGRAYVVSFSQAPCGSGIFNWWSNFLSYRGLGQ
ncbi:MAG: integrin alpha [Chloroflexota bacterium]